MDIYAKHKKWSLRVHFLDTCISAVYNFVFPFLNWAIQSCINNDVMAKKETFSPTLTGRCRFTHTQHIFQWRLRWPVDEIIQTLTWNIYLQDIKLIFHMSYKQREMNSLPVILTYFMQGGGKCLFFCHIYPCQWDI
jgi:hypothetical protein